MGRLHVQHAAGGGHHQGRSDAVATDVSHDQTERATALFVKRNEVVVVAAGFIAVDAAPGDLEVLQRRGLLGQQAVLDGRGQAQGLLHSLQVPQFRPGLIEDPPQVLQFILVSIST